MRRRGSTVFLRSSLSWPRRRASLRCRQQRQSSLLCRLRRKRLPPSDRLLSCKRLSPLPSPQRRLHRHSFPLERQHHNLRRQLKPLMEPGFCKLPGALHRSNHHTLSNRSVSCKRRRRHLLKRYHRDQRLPKPRIRHLKLPRGPQHHRPMDSSTGSLPTSRKFRKVLNYLNGRLNHQLRQEWLHHSNMLSISSNTGIIRRHNSNTPRGRSQLLSNTLLHISSKCHSRENHLWRLLKTPGKQYLKSSPARRDQRVRHRHLNLVHNPRPLFLLRTGPFSHRFSSRGRLLLHLLQGLRKVVSPHHSLRDGLKAMYPLASGSHPRCRLRRREPTATSQPSHHMRRRDHLFQST